VAKGFGILALVVPGSEVHAGNLIEYGFAVGGFKIFLLPYITDGAPAILTGTDHNATPVRLCATRRIGGGHKKVSTAKAGYQLVGNINYRIINREVAQFKITQAHGAFGVGGDRHFGTDTGSVNGMNSKPVS
jgi:hypothetical protein